MSHNPRKFLVLKLFFNLTHWLNTSVFREIQLSWLSHIIRYHIYHMVSLLKMVQKNLFIKQKQTHRFQNL